MKFIPHGLGKQNQSVTYTAVKEHVMQHVQKTYCHRQDMAISLWEMQKIDLSQHKPKRTMASPNEKEKEFLQEWYDILYKAQVRKYIDRLSMLTENLAKAYALICSTYCNQMMMHRIEYHQISRAKYAMIQSNYCEQLKYWCTTQKDPSICMHHLWNQLPE